MDRTVGKIKKQGNQYCVVSEDGSKSFGCFDSKSAAQKRLGQVEFFKKSKSQTNSFEGPQKPTDGKTKTKKKKKPEKKKTYSEVTMADGVKNPTESQIGGADHVQAVEDNRKVPEVKLPSLDNTGTREQVIAAFNDASEKDQRTMAENVAETIQKRIEKLQDAKKLADRLLKDGMTGDEFGKMISYLQEDVVSELTFQGVKASSYRKRVFEQAVRNRG